MDSAGRMGRAESALPGPSSGMMGMGMMGGGVMGGHKMGGGVQHQSRRRNRVG